MKETMRTTTTIRALLALACVVLMGCNDGLEGNLPDSQPDMMPDQAAAPDPVPGVEIVATAAPTEATVGGGLVQIRVEVAIEGEPLAAGQTIDLFEAGCDGGDPPPVGLFDSQIDGECGRTTSTVTGEEGSLAVNFRCVREGNTVILAVPTNTDAEPGQVAVGCVAQQP